MTLKRFHEFKADGQLVMMDLDEMLKKTDVIEMINRGNQHWVTMGTLEDRNVRYFYKGEDEILAIKHYKALTDRWQELKTTHKEKATH